MNIFYPKYSLIKRIIRLSNFLILFFVASSNIYGKNTPHIVSTSLYQDATQKLTLPEIQKMDSIGQFKTISPKTVLAYSSDISWIKVVVSNPEDKSCNFFLRYKKAFTHLVHFYEIGKDSVRESISGYSIPDSCKEVIANAICFPLSLSPRSTNTYFLQIISPYSKEVEISLIDRRQLDKDERDYDIFAGAIILALIVISLYNMFLGIGLKDSMYFHFVITNIGDTFCTAAMLGVMPIVFPFLPFARSPFFNAVSIGLFGALSANFVIHFLKLKQNHKLWYWILVFVIAVELFAIVHGTISWYWFKGTYGLISPINLIGIPITFAVCIVAYIKGSKDARFLFLGWLFLVVGAIIKILSLLGTIPDSWLSDHFVFIADVMESVLLSFALADRYNRMQNEKLQLEIDLRTKEKDLTLLAANNKVRYNERKVFLSDLQELSKSEPDNLPAKLRSLIFNLVQKLDSEEKIIYKADNIQVLNAEFEDKLKSSFPKLTQTDIELCGYIKLNMSVKEIADIKRTSEAAIKMARYRLKGKLKLDNQKLDDFIQINF